MRLRGGAEQEAVGGEGGGGQGQIPPAGEESFLKLQPGKIRRALLGVPGGVPGQGTGSVVLKISQGDEQGRWVSGAFTRLRATIPPPPTERQRGRSIAWSSGSNAKACC